MKIENLIEENNQLKFTLSDINVSIANAIRRIILSEIPCVVFKTTPYEENKVDIEINTSRMNNELIKQRLSCIPIYISDINAPIENYKIIIDKQNTSDIVEYVTTEDIQILDKNLNKLLNIEETRNIFPKNKLTNYFIDIARLRPALSKEIAGEQLKLTADLSVGTAKEDGTFNVVSTCSYGNTPDVSAIEEQITKKMVELEEKKFTKEEIDFTIKDWRLLNSEMYAVKDSFDFIIETIGQYSNSDLIVKATDIMLNKLNKLMEDIQTQENIIKSSNTTLENGFDITLFNEDYTLGKALEYMLYTKYYNSENNILNFCGFKKPHPHIDESLIRLGFTERQDKDMVITIITSAINDLITIFTNILDYFKT